MIISKPLAKEIDNKREVLAGNPVYYLSRHKKCGKCLDDSKQIHSWLIEHPNVREIILGITPGSKRKALRKLVKKGVENLNRTWHYLMDSKDYLNSEVLLRAGSLVEPGKNYDGFRDVRVSLGMDHIPPNYVKVPGLIGKVFDEARQSNAHTVEKAAILHLKLASIQPFIDGNKRVSRLYQDRILFGDELPTAFIPVGEREVYLDLLEQGWKGIHEGNVELQVPFVDYVGGKVNTALDCIIGDISAPKRK